MVLTNLDPERPAMSVSDSHPQPKATRPVFAKKKRFPKVPVVTAPLQPLSLTPQQKLMGQLLPASVLTQLAQQHHAYDERRRKVTCVVFFWMALWAFGPGGRVTLHQLITSVLVAQLVAGVGLTRRCAGEPGARAQDADAHRRPRLRMRRSHSLVSGWTGS